MAKSNKTGNKAGLIVAIAAGAGVFASMNGVPMLLALVAVPAVTYSATRGFVRSISTPQPSSIDPVNISLQPKQNKLVNRSFGNILRTTFDSVVVRTNKQSLNSQNVAPRESALKEFDKKKI